MVVVKDAMGKGAARTHAAKSQRVSPYEVGSWQEDIIWDVTKSVLEENLGTYEVQNVRDPDVKQILRWGQNGDIYEVTWYKPNTHPVKTGSISKPEFGITKNGVQIINIESKNWDPYYKPLSLCQVERQIITRFRYIPALDNVLVISEFRMEPTAWGQVWDLFADYNVNIIILTHRQAISSHDARSRKRIDSSLSTLLMEKLKLGPFQTPQNEAKCPI
jgi:hypothetical protein